MRIAVIGTGAMGSVYGGRLSQHNEMYLVDTVVPVVERIQKGGLKPQENGEDIPFSPITITSTEGVGTMDLVIPFVKTLSSRMALSGNGSPIGPDVYVMILQNDSGHEDISGKFVDQDHIITGTTEDNGAILGLDYVRRGGVSNTNMGMLTEDKNGSLPKLEEAFGCCDFSVKIHENIQQLIWDKLFTNVSLNTVTGILQVGMGYIATNEHTQTMTISLIRGAVAMAKAMGLTTDEEQTVAKVKKASEISSNGCTSIRADLRDGRRTEVDIISDSMVHAVAKVGVPVPNHGSVMNMVHVLEGKN